MNLYATFWEISKLCEVINGCSILLVQGPDGITRMIFGSLGVTKKGFWALAQFYMSLLVLLEGPSIVDQIVEFIPLFLDT